MRDTVVRPVLALLRALDELDAHRDEPGYAGRGTARRRAVNARNHLPRGALDLARAREIEDRWRLHFEGSIAPPAASAPPDGELATTYWLSSGDAEGAVLRARLERLPPRRKPWSDFWPCAVDTAADQAAEDAQRRAASLARFQPSEPLRGWHRVVPAEGEPETWRDLSIEGRSLSAPLALMLLSEWLERPLDPTLAVTGDLDAELRLVLPGDSKGSVAAKVRAAVRERACIRAVFVPRGARPDLAASTRVEVIEINHLAELAARFSLPCAEASPRPISVQGWMQAVDEAEWLIRARAAPGPVMRDRLERLEEVARGFEAMHGEKRAPSALAASRLRLLGRLCGYHAHQIDAPAALEESGRIDRLLADARLHGRAVPRALVATVRNVQASLMIDRLRFDTARRHAAEAREAALAAGEATEGARIASTRGRVEAHARKDQLALDLLRGALAELEEAIPWETNLCACYLVGVLGRLRRLDEADAALARAREHALSTPGVTEGWRSDNLLYLAYEELKLALLGGDLPRAKSALAECDRRCDPLARGPWPAAGIAVRGAEALLLSGDRDAAFKRLTDLRALAAQARSPETYRMEHGARGRAAPRPRSRRREARRRGARARRSRLRGEHPGRRREPAQGATRRRPRGARGARGAPSYPARTRSRPSSTQRSTDARASSSSATRPRGARVRPSTCEPPSREGVHAHSDGGRVHGSARPARVGGAGGIDRDADPPAPSVAPAITGSPGPPPQVRLKETSASGDISRDMIRHYARPAFLRAQRCYEEALAQSPGRKLAGTVTVTFLVEKTGVVSAATNSGSDLPDAGVVACVVQSFVGLRYPEHSQGQIVVSYPLVFPHP